MDQTTILIGLALIFGFYMAWNIGANDVANAMGTSVGSGALTLAKAIVVAAVFEFLGAYLIGSHVASTISSGIFDPALVKDPKILAIGMIAALLASGVWLQIASFFGWPVSTTHTIVGAVAGFGAIVVGAGNEHWQQMSSIVGSWIITPVLAGAISYMLFNFLRHKIFFQEDPVAAAKRICPYLFFIVVAVLASVTSIEGLKNFWIKYSLSPLHGLGLIITILITVIAGSAAALIGRKLVNRIPDEPSTQPSSTNYFQAQQIARSLDKVKKHLGRIDALSNSQTQKQTSYLLSEVSKIEEQTQKQLNAKTTHSAYEKVERIFISLQILTACFMAFSHGANDVANAIGPLAAAMQALQTGAVPSAIHIPDWILILGGAGIVIGLATFGWRVMKTVGKRITELTPSRGFAAEFATAATVLSASLLGLPVSTTQTLVGAIIGVGMARGIGAINLGIIRNIIASWLITIPAGAGLAIVFFYILKAMFI